MTTTGLPHKYESVSFKDYEITNTNQNKLRTSAEEYVDDLDSNREKGLGFAILGSPGLGKTMIACCIGNSAIHKGYTVRFVTLASYVRLHLEAFTLQNAWQKIGDIDAYIDWQRKQDYIKKLRTRYDFVIVDDVGKEHTTGSNFAEDEFDYLVRRRAHLGLPTILTSNSAVSQWSDKYSASMASFLREACIVKSVEGSDYRRANNGRV